jgi:ankyrin repeat protein
VKLLLKKSADPNSKDTSDRTPLLLAAQKGHESAVKLLLVKDGVDPDLQGRPSWLDTAVVGRRERAQGGV